MSSLDGGLAAVAIQDLALEHKNQCEEKLAEAIRRYAGDILHLPREVVESEAFDPFISALRRATKQVNITDRAAQILVKLKYEAMRFSKEFETWESTPREAYETHNQDEFAIHKIFQATQLLRTEAHTSRTTLSYLKGVCRPLYTSWIEQFPEDGSSISHHSLAARQDELINTPIRDADDFVRWCDAMLGQFETASTAIKYGSDGRLPTGLVSMSALRHYQRAWREFTREYEREILDLMQQYDSQDRPSKSERDFKFHRPLMLGSRSRKPEQNFSYLRGSEYELSEASNEIIKQQRADQLPQPSIRKGSGLESNLEHDADHARVSISLTEGGTSGVTMNKSWDDIYSAKTEFAFWLDSRASLIERNVIASARLQIHDSKHPEDFEVKESDVETIKQRFSKLLDFASH